MARFTIRNVDGATKELLRTQAARNGRSITAEVKAMLREALFPAGEQVGHDPKTKSS